jgi:MoaA/NifB/PqqE/SkfB family radical SAM enzyme
MNYKNETCLFELVDKKRVTWEITKKCNYNCKHCCNNCDQNAYDDELTTSKIFEVIDDMVLNDVESIYFSGGEPLLRKDMIDILKYTDKKGIKKINLATNGSLINENITKELSKIKINSILISLDGQDEKTHTDFRNIQSSFKDAINAAKMLSNNGVKVKFGCVIWKDNYKHLEEILKIGIECKVDTVFYNWLLKSGRGLENKEIFIDNNEYLTTAKKIFELKEKYKGIINVGFHRFREIKDDFPSCQGGSKLFHINARGQISPCSWIAKQSNDFLTDNTLNNSSFSDLINDYKINNFLNLVKIRNTKYGPGCLGVCFAEHKTYMENDPLYYKNGVYLQK